MTTDWFIAGPALVSAGSFGLVYLVALASGAPTERVLLVSSAALLVAGVMSIMLSRLLSGARPPRPFGHRIDITIDEAPAEGAAAGREEAA